MELIKPGTYTARIVDYGICATKAGAPQARVTLEFMEDGQKRQLTWFSGFGDKQIKHTLKALVICGLNCAIEELADGLDCNGLDLTKDVAIIVEHDTYEGKVSAKVCWINAPAGDKFGKLMDKGSVKAKLGALNLKGELAAIRNELGVKPAPKPALDSNFDLGDVSL